LAKDQHVVRVASPPSLAMLWLVERVGRFMQLHEGITVAVTSVRDPAAVLESSFDVGFWYGEGRLSGLRMARMGPNHLFPICHKDLMHDGRHARQPAAISRATLLDSGDETYYERMQPRQGWRSWLKAARVPEATGTRFLNFTPHLLMHRAVEGRLGIGLSRTLLAADALASGELGIPFGPGIAQRATYHVVYPAAAANRKEIVAFRDWILAEAEASTATLHGILNMELEAG
jgi:LysR family glycine cleavage system transcriptional activator